MSGAHTRCCALASGSPGTWLVFGWAAIDDFDFDRSSTCTAPLPHDHTRLNQSHRHTRAHCLHLLDLPLTPSSPSSASVRPSGTRCTQPLDPPHSSPFPLLPLPTSISVHQVSQGRSCPSAGTWSSSKIQGRTLSTLIRPLDLAWPTDLTGRRCLAFVTRA